MKPIVLSVLAVVLVAKAAQAAGPVESLRPMARGQTGAPAAVIGESLPVDGAASAALRPVTRPADLQGDLQAGLAQALKQAGVPGFVPETASRDIALVRAFAARSPQATGRSLRPALRPDDMVTRIMGKRRAEKQARTRGAVCGDPDIQGDVIGFVPGRLRGCGIDQAVSVRSVAGVALSQKAQIDCNTARALKQWVAGGLKPVLGKQGGGVASIKVAAHYACRTRNNQPGGKISEHGRGRALDISAFRLRDGSEIDILNGWKSSRYGKALRKLHEIACGPFGTVLGPNSDRFHRDHFHLDTARYRSGSYCR